jgi:hypothetical protein
MSNQNPLEPDPKDWVSFIKDSHGRKRIWIRCAHKQFNNKTRSFDQCRIEMRRDHFKGKKHTCVFNTLDNYASSIKKDAPILNSVLTLTARFVVRHNISLRSACSPELYDLLHHCFILGQQNPQTIEFQHIVPRFSRMSFTSPFQQHADDLKTSLFKAAKGNWALAIDAGKVGGRMTLNIVLVSCLSNLSPILFKAVRYFIYLYTTIEHRVVHQNRRKISPLNFELRGEILRK